MVNIYVVNVSHSIVCLTNRLCSLPKQGLHKVGSFSFHHPFLSLR